MIVHDRTRLTDRLHQPPPQGGHFYQSATVNIDYGLRAEPDIEGTRRLITALEDIESPKVLSAATAGLRGCRLGDLLDQFEL